MKEKYYFLIIFYLLIHWQHHSYSSWLRLLFHIFICHLVISKQCISNQHDIRIENVGVLYFFRLYFLLRLLVTNQIKIQKANESVAEEPAAGKHFEAHVK